MSYQIQFDFGTGWVNTEAVISDLTFTEVLHKNLKSADDSLKGKLIPTVALLNSLRGAGKSDVPARILEDGSAIFTGYLRKTFNISKTQRLQPVAFEIVSPSNALKKKIKSNLFYTDKYVSDTADTSHSLIHLLLVHSGLSLSDINIPDITHTIPVFSIEENTITYHKVIEEILFNYGYVLSFDKDGKFIIKELFPDYEYVDIVNYFTGDNCLDEITQTKVEEEKSIIEVKWSAVDTLSNTIIFSESTGAENGNKCNVIIPPDSYMGEEKGSTEWYATYGIEGREFIAAKDFVVSILKNNDIVVETFTPYHTKALLSIYNSNLTTPMSVTKLDLIGTAYVKKDVNISKVSNDSDGEIETIEANYIFDKTVGDTLASKLASYYKYSDFTYKLSSKSDYAIGEIVEISETGLGSSQVRIIGKRKNILTKKIEYVLEAVSEYSPETPTYEVNVPNYDRTAADIANIDTTNYPSYSDLQNGYDTGGGTITPIPPTLTIRSFIRSTALTWDRQYNLTNPLQYELQVSDDELTWYSLKGDGTDWKDVEDDVTIIYAGTQWYFHANIPPSGTEEEPLPRTLFYRIRMRTNQGVISDWSIVVESETNLISAPDLIANSITADKLEIGLLNALLAQFGGIEVIEGGQAFNLDSLTRLVLSPYMIEWQTRPDIESEWTIRRRIGDSTGDEVLADIIRFRGLFPLDRDFDSSVGYPRPDGSLTYNLDGTLTDQNDANAFTIVEDISYTQGKFGPDDEGAIEADPLVDYAGEISKDFTTTVEDEWTIAAWMKHSGPPTQPTIDPSVVWDRYNELIGPFDSSTNSGLTTEFSYDNKYVATSADTFTGNVMTIYRNNYDDSFTRVFYQPYTLAFGRGVRLNWSHDNKYLALASIFGTTLPYSARVHIYENNDDDTFTLIDTLICPQSGSTLGLDVVWSPDDTYLAFSYGGSANSRLLMYKHDGSGGFTSLGYLPYKAGEGEALEWSPNGDYLLTAVAAVPGLTIYKNNRDDTFTKLTGTPALSFSCYGCTWSPDSNYFVMGSNTAPRVHFFTNNHDDTFTACSAVTTTGGLVCDLNWSPDGKMIAAADRWNNSYNVHMYKNEGIGTFTKLPNLPDLEGGPGSYSVGFSKDSKYLAVSNSGAPYFKMYKARVLTEYWEFPENDELPRLAQIGTIYDGRVGLYHLNEGLVLAREDEVDVSNSVSFPSNQWNFVVIRSNGDGTYDLKVNNSSQTLATSITGTNNLKLTLRALLENEMKIDEILYLEGLASNETLTAYYTSGTIWADVTYGDTFIGCSPGKVIRVMDEVVFNGATNFKDGIGQVGTVLAFAMESAPSGWLKCNGAAISRTTYSALFTAIGTTFGAGDGSTTFNVPDLRGEFVRGWDDARAVDTGRVFGSAQADELKSHTHVYVFTGEGSATTFGAGGTPEYAYDVNTSATGGTETRPRNIALLYCIKY